MVEDLDFLETVAISALVRVGDDDHKLNSLLGRICAEIDFPLIPPVVTTLSDFRLYYHIHCSLNLMRVPCKRAGSCCICQISIMSYPTPSCKRGMTRPSNLSEMLL